MKEGLVLVLVVLARLGILLLVIVANIEVVGHLSNTGSTRFLFHVLNLVVS